MTSLSTQQGIELVLRWLDALRRRDRGSAEELLAPDVHTHGIRPEQICGSREEALEVFFGVREQDLGIDRLDITSAGDRVVLGFRGEGVEEDYDDALTGQLFNVFSVRDGRIVRIEDYRRRADALAAAGIPGEREWR